MNPLLLLLPALAIAAPEKAKSSDSLLGPELRNFLGNPPAQFDKTYREPAKALRKALLSKSRDSEIKALGPLTKGALGEHALFALGMALREKKDFARSRTELSRLQEEFPGTPYSDLVLDAQIANDCDQGRQVKSGARELLLRCLQRTAWKEWADRESEATTLYRLLKSTKDPLLGPFVAEVVQALPPASPLRVRIQKENKDADLRAWSSVARFRTRLTTPAGVKAVNPDLVLFDQGMQKVLEGSWADANGLFKLLTADFPQSEHLDRAQYWVARSEEALGNTEEARRRYDDIRRANPLSYYGLQSALRMKQDPSLLITPFSGAVPKLEGTLLTRQALSLWKLRALLEAGLLEPARMEAKNLFQQRPGGATFGQDSAAGAAMVAQLYHVAGYSLAAFSHAYAAATLDESALNGFTLETLFPDPFPKEFGVAAEATGVHPLLLLSVAKQESAFLPQAISRANALGLLQLLPTTAREVIPQITREELFTPGPNALAGARYLQKLLDRFQGNIALALAGYNAGPSRAVAWQKKMLESALMQKQFDVDVFIDTIPFTETRRYVGSILRNYAWYKLLARDKIDSVQELVFQWRKNQQNETMPLPAFPPEPAVVSMEETNLAAEPPATAAAPELVGPPLAPAPTPAPMPSPSPANP